MFTNQEKEANFNVQTEEITVRKCSLTPERGLAEEDLRRCREQYNKLSSELRKVKTKKCETERSFNSLMRNLNELKKRERSENQDQDMYEKEMLRLAKKKTIAAELADRLRSKQSEVIVIVCS